MGPNQSVISSHLRVVEKNQEIVDNLQRIITACQTCPTATDPKAADAR